MSNFWLEKLLVTLFDHSLIVCYFIIAVLLIRGIFRKMPRKWICVLWLLVGISLACPVTIESPFSVISEESVAKDVVFKHLTTDSNTESTTLYISPKQEHETIGVGQPIVNEEQQTEQSVVYEETETGFWQQFTHIASIIWVAGIVVMIAYGIYSYLRIYSKVRFAVPEIVNGKKIYRCDKIDSSFLFGFIRQRIMIPTGLKGKSLELITEHELVHKKRGDFITKPVAYLLLTVFWFQPFVWVAYFCLCRDIELACDEQVIGNIGEQCKADYSQALLNESVPRRFITLCPVAFGEIGVKKRVKNVLSYKNPAMWVSVLAILVVIIVAACFMTRKEDKEQAAIGSEVQNEQENAEDAKYGHVDEYDVSAGETGNGHVDVYDVSTGEYIDVEYEEIYDVSQVGGADDGEVEVNIQPSGVIGEFKDENGTSIILGSEDSGYFISNGELYADIDSSIDDSRYVKYKYDHRTDQWYNAETDEVIELPDRVKIGLGTYSNDARANQIAHQYEEFIYWYEDLTHDGIKDEIIVDLTNVQMPLLEEEKTIRVISGATGKEVFWGTAHEVHSGYTSYYLYKREGEYYLFQWSPDMWQGDADYHYELFYVTEDGEKKVVTEDSLEFIYEDPAKDLDMQLLDFSKRVNMYLQYSTLLINTYSGQTYYGVPGKNVRLLYNPIQQIQDLRYFILDKYGELAEYPDVTYCSQESDYVWERIVELTPYSDSEWAASEIDYLEKELTRLSNKSEEVSTNAAEEFQKQLTLSSYENQVEYYTECEEECREKLAEAIKWRDYYLGVADDLEKLDNSEAYDINYYRNNGERYGLKVIEYEEELNTILRQKEYYQNTYNYLFEQYSNQ